MSWQERKTRREFLEWFGGLFGTFVLVAPLVRKFVGDTLTLDEVHQPPGIPPKDENLPPQPAPESTGAQTSRFEVKAKTGVELLRNLGLEGKIVYIVYGRPQKYEGQETWGSLGAGRTAEESWQIVQNLRGKISQEIGRSDTDFALRILNPVYRSGGGVIEDIYIQKALELAHENRGLVALNFNSISDAIETIQRLEGVLPKELLPYLAVGLDIEHFPNRKATAEEINEFSSWFAGKHKEWMINSPNNLLPGLIILYTLHGSSQAGEIGRILNLEALKQYYLDEKTLVVPVFDGYGSREAKLAKMRQIIASLPNTPDYPPLLGVMEFSSRWGNRYDSCDTDESFSTLWGAPVFFFASQ